MNKDALVITAFLSEALDGADGKYSFRLQGINIFDS